MFSLRAFIKKGLLDAVGKQPDYWVILNAAGWMEKGVLTEEDLAEIQAAMEAREQIPEAAEEVIVSSTESGEADDVSGD